MTQRTSNSQPDAGRSPKGMPTSAKMGVNISFSFGINHTDDKAQNTLNANLCQCIKIGSFNSENLTNAGKLPKLCI